MCIRDSLRCIPTPKRLLKGQRSYRAFQQQVTTKTDPYPGNHSAVHVLASDLYLGASAYGGAFIFQDDMPDSFVLLHWKQVQHDYLMWSKPSQLNRRWVESLIKKLLQVAWDHWGPWEHSN